MIKKSSSTNELRRAIHESLAVHGTRKTLTVEQVQALEAKGHKPLFSKLVLEEARHLPDVSAELLRRRNVEGITFTIDGRSTRDLDDAFSYREEPDGTRVVGIHIADVAAHVRLGSALDFSARQRVESKYADNLHVPMFPVSLSENAFSLNEGQERLTKSVELRFAPSGQLLSTELFDSKLVNQHRLTKNAAKKLQKGEGNPALSHAVQELSKIAAALLPKETGRRKMAPVEVLVRAYMVHYGKAVAEALRDAGIETSFRTKTDKKAPSLYEPVAKFHEKTGFDAYTQSTSPIRRAADLDVQRGLNELFSGQRKQGRVAELDQKLRAAFHARANADRPLPEYDFVADVDAMTAGKK